MKLSLARMCLYRWLTLCPLRCLSAWGSCWSERISNGKNGSRRTADSLCRGSRVAGRNRQAGAEGVLGRDEEAEEGGEERDREDGVGKCHCEDGDGRIEGFDGWQMRGLKESFDINERRKKEGLTREGEALI
jgi:hypothetical protein